jgi:hypothetical protein
MQNYTSDVEMIPVSLETRVVPSRAETGVSSLVASTPVQLADTTELKTFIYDWAKKYEGGNVKNAVIRFKKVISTTVENLSTEEMIIMREFSSFIIKYNIKTENFFYLFNTILKPLETLYGSSHYYLPDSGEQIKELCIMFGDIFTNHKKYINNLFIVEKIIPVTSVNGKAFVINTKQPNINNALRNKLLVVKVALNSESDSLSYEYYIGRFLNILRVENITDVFALMYGRFKCNYNIVNPGDELCQTISNVDNNKVHIITEYVRNVSTEKNISLYNFINERFSTNIGLQPDVIFQNLLRTNIIIKGIIEILLMSLQGAQDRLNFTHYDLHLNNILIIEHAQKKKYFVGYNSVEVRYMPHIIDYGRCYINPSRVLDQYKELYDRTNIIYMDDNRTIYTSFEEMQTKWAKTFVSKEYLSVEKMVEEYMLNNIKDYINKNFGEEINTKLEEKKREIERDVEEAIKKGDINKKTGDFYKKEQYEKFERDLFMKYKKDSYKNFRRNVYETYVGNETMDITNEQKNEYFPKEGGLKRRPDNIYVLPHTTPTKPHSQHDMFKVVMSICNLMIYNLKIVHEKKMLTEDKCQVLAEKWNEIRDYLKEEFPIYAEKGSMLFKEIQNDVPDPKTLLEKLIEIFDKGNKGNKGSMDMTGGGADDIKKNEIKLESENSLKMNQLKDVKDIPKMYYSVVTDDEYNKYIENEIKKMLAKKDRSEMTEFELKAEAGLKKLFKEKK